MDNPILLVDSYSQIYRGYYAVRALTTAAGVPSNAVFAMAKFLLKLQQDYGSWDGAFVFDKGHCAARLEIAPQYKANRLPMPEDLRSQMEPIRELIEAFGWPILEKEGFEADDLIACIAEKSAPHPVRIVSADKDLSQIIDDRVQMLVPNREGTGFLVRDIPATLEKFGVPPSGIVDYLALIGDSSDNIPGVEGIGPKTAAALISQFGSIDAMLAAPEKIAREALREKIVASADILRLNRRLIRMDCTIPMKDISFIGKSPPDFVKIREIAERMELRSILRELEKISGSTTPPPAPAGNDSAQMEFKF